MLVLDERSEEDESFDGFPGGFSKGSESVEHGLSSFEEDLADGFAGLTDLGVREGFGTGGEDVGVFGVSGRVR